MAKQPQDYKQKARRNVSTSSSTWDELMDEVTIEPFTLTDPEGVDYKIHQPTGAEARAIREQLNSDESDDEDVFRLIVGDEVADAFAPHFENAPAPAVTALVIKLTNHFNAIVDPTSRT